jgi:DNA-binding LacI/PurR family transcriptional regulator
MPSAITIKEISKITGYSISTVSKALNDRYKIKESTKEEIRKVAKQNNYVPNNAARALRNKRTHIIGVILPEITSTYFNTFLCKIQKKASQIDYKVMISQSFNDAQKEREGILQMNDGTVDGILVLTNHQISKKDFEYDVLGNVVVVPYDHQEELHETIVKSLAVSSFEEVIALINKNHTSMYD